MEFDLIETPIQPGTILIEASAGTGKTFALSILYLRLLVEAGLSSDQILAVTFTEAATRELRARLQKVIGMAVRVQQGIVSQDPMALYIQAILKKNTVNVEGAYERLRSSLDSFDQAPISTIHSFCYSVLTRFPFETGHVLTAQIIPDVEVVLNSLAEDFWRSYISQQHSYVVAAAIELELTPQRLVQFWKRVLSQHGLKMEHELSKEVAEQQIKEALGKLKVLEREWVRILEDLYKWFEQNKNFLKKEWGDGEKISLIFDIVGRAVMGEAFTPQAIKLLAELRPEKIVGAVDKRFKAKTTPVPESLKFVQYVVESQYQLGRGLYIISLAYLKERLPEFKERSGILVYDDLLLRVAEALEGDRGKDLIRQLRGIYKAALVDEFQDTDPLQYEVLKRIFEPAKGSLERYLILIGDPKQSIYSFRGADVFTYLKAAKQVSKVFTLTRNWRSTPDLLRAINTLFGTHSNPFVFPEIGYLPIFAGDPGSKRRLVISGSGEEPGLEIWFYKGEDEKPLTKSEARARIYEHVASEVTRLLNSGASIDHTPISAGHIAILVRENQQAKRMQKVLSRYNVPSVLHTTESVFHTHEAWELWCVLSAILNPGKEAQLRAALLMPMFGRRLDDAFELTTNEAEWSEIVSRFKGYLQIWERRGLFPMFQALVEVEGVKPNLMRFVDGERRITNLYQIVELLHQAESETGPDPLRTMSWFARKMFAREIPPEEYQTRLESDRDAVKIVTIHRSKGLEYDIVFCPFCWEGIGGDRNKTLVRPTIIRDPVKKESLLCFDTPGTKINEDAFAVAIKESLSEEVRVVYVALTRAKVKSYLIWGIIGGSETSPLCWLFMPPETQANDKQASYSFTTDVVTRGSSKKNWLIPWSPQAGVEMVQSKLLSLEKQNKDAIRVVINPDPQPSKLLSQSDSQIQLPVLKSIWRVPKPSWESTSYSSLITGEDLDLTDYEIWAEPPVDEGIENEELPRGVIAGECLHRILEKIDLARPESELNLRIIKKELNYAAISESYVPKVVEMVKRLSAAKLVPSPGLICKSVPEIPIDIRLGDIPLHKKVCEMEFGFSVRRFDFSEVIKVLVSYGINRACELEARTPPGSPTVVKGYIDMLFEAGGKFYVVDWKSNWLGDTPSDYTPEKLAREILRQHYYLQYLIYTIAVEKFLQWRVRDYHYDRCFGGVWFIFLRGVFPEVPGSGIYYDRVPGKLIDEIGKYLVVEPIVAKK